MSKGLRKSQNNSNKQLIQFDGNEVQSNSSMFESRPTGSIVEFPNPHTPGNFHECRKIHQVQRKPRECDLKSLVTHEPEFNKNLKRPHPQPPSQLLSQVRSYPQPQSKLQPPSELNLRRLQNLNTNTTLPYPLTGDYQLERIPQTQYTAAETRPLRYSPAVGRNSAVNTTQAMPFWRPPNSHIKTMQVVSSKYNTLQKKNSNEVTETWPNSMTQKAKIVLLTLRITVGCLVLNHQPLWGLALFVLFFGSYAIDEMDNRLKKCRLMQTQNRNMAGYATCDNTDYRKIK